MIPIPAVRTDEAEELANRLRRHVHTLAGDS
jgi:hypothetical protein